MSSPAPHVVPIFATPFGVVTVPEAQALNPVLAARSLTRGRAPTRTATRRTSTCTMFSD